MTLSHHLFFSKNVKYIQCYLKPCIVYSHHTLTHNRQSKRKATYSPDDPSDMIHLIPKHPTTSDPKHPTTSDHPVTSDPTTSEPPHPTTSEPPHLTTSDVTHPTTTDVTHITPSLPSVPIAVT